MKWLRRVLEHLRRPAPAEVQRVAKHERTIRKADRVLADYARQDGALRIVVVKKPS